MMEHRSGARNFRTNAKPYGKSHSLTEKKDTKAEKSFKSTKSDLRDEYDFHEGRNNKRKNSYSDYKKKKNIDFKKSEKPFSGEESSYKEKGKRIYNKHVDASKTNYRVNDHYGKRSFKKDERSLKKQRSINKLCVVAAFHSPTFSGRVGSEILRACKALGINVCGSERKTYLTQKGFSYGNDVESMISSSQQKDVFKLWAAPLYELPKIDDGKHTFVVTSFDIYSSNIPQLGNLKKVKHIWVPSVSHKELCVKAGIDKKDVSVFQIPVCKIFNKIAVRPAELSKKENTFRFLVSAPPVFSSGIDDILYSYIKEFKPEEKVELVIKLTHMPNLKKNLTFELSGLQKQLGALNNMFAKVTVVSRTLSEEDYSGLVASADAVISAEMAASGSFCVKEALSCGIPVIAPDWLLGLEDLKGKGIIPVATETRELEAGKLYTDSPEQKVKTVNREILSKSMRKAFDERIAPECILHSDCISLAKGIASLLK